MSSKLLPSDKELYQRVCEIAHYMWDPIGVSDIPQAHDEYNSYVWALFERAKTGDIAQIMEYMKWAETENMGLSFNKDGAEKAAQAMVAWKEFIDEKQNT